MQRPCYRWTDNAIKVYRPVGRQPFPYPITEGLPVIRPKSRPGLVVEALSKKRRLHQQLLQELRFSAHFFVFGGKSKLRWREPSCSSRPTGPSSSRYRVAPSWPCALSIPSTTR